MYKKYKNLFKGNVLILITFSVCMIAYISIRAYALSFTHDESVSFKILEGCRGIMFTANFHALNTILMFVSKILFGNSEFALRLPNVLSGLLYLTGCYYIFRQSKNNWLLLFGFCLALLNPFLIEFFSLARGYGLSIAFMLMSIYFVIKNEKCTMYSILRKDFISSVLFASLAAGANLIMINFLISILIIFNIKFWHLLNRNNEEAKNIKDFLCLFFVSCIPLAIGIFNLLILNKLGELFYGAMSFNQGVDSLIIKSIYFHEYSSWVITIIKLIIILFFLIGALLIVLKKKFNGSLFYTMLLFVLLTIGLHIEHFLFGAKFPLERTALFYVPVIAVYVYYLFLELMTEFKLKKQVYITIILCIISPLSLNFVVGMNIKHTKSWEYDAHTKDSMKVIRNYTENADCSFSISSHWLFEPTINYYIRIWNLKLNPASRDGVSLNSDFIYKFNESSMLDGYYVLNFYDDTKSYLLIKNEINKK